MTGKYSVTHPERKTSPAEVSVSQTEMDTLLRMHLREDPKVWKSFTEELHTLITAGLPIEQALVFLIRSSQLARVRSAAAHIHKGLMQGHGLQQVLDDSVKSNVPPVIRAYLIMGAQSGDFGRLLDQAADIFRMRLELRSDIRAVLWYPSFLVIAGSCIMAVRDILIASFGKGDVAMAQTRALNNYIWPLCWAFIISLVIAAVMRLVAGKNWSSWLRLKIPLIGGLTRRYNTAMFFDVLATGIASGMQPQRAWTLGARCLNQAWMTSEIMKRLRFIEDGDSLTTAYRGLPFADRQSAVALETGEQAGELPRVLRHQAKQYREEVRRVFRPLTRIMGPMMLPVVAIGYFIYPPALTILGFFMFLLWIIV